MSTRGAQRPGARDYTAFRQLDGRHPLKRSVPGGFVDYPARRVRGSRVVFFNFALAREMGLIKPEHPDRLVAPLRRAILDSFSLVIVNEYDRQRGLRVAPRDRLPGSYMATRYLQLQHPGRQGRTSGDGRSVWFGCVSHDGTTWDVSGCGTGVTRLCPATAEQGRFFKTGNRISDYGCGTASMLDGLSAALMSETLHRNGVATERVLAVIGLANGFAINVRAARNLLRPSHFFLYLKQNDQRRLRAVVDLFLDRQENNGVLPRRRGKQRYRGLVEELARTFGRAAATFESEYIFCWLDWDGDNILADGGIVDYGSVRQFGLYHREYRFDDGPRWSTTLPEQRAKARHLVRCLAQIRDFVVDGRKRPLARYARDSVLRLFDAEFARTRLLLLLRRVGFRAAAVESLLRRERPLVQRFLRAHAYFERARSARGPRAVDDGLNWNAVFSTRDLLRELPRRLLAGDRPPTPREILDIAASTYALPADRRLTPHRARMARELVRCYVELIERAARHARRPPPLLLTELAQRAAVINRFDRITGDSALYAARKLLSNRNRLSPERFHLVIERFLEHQTLVPDRNPVSAGRTGGCAGSKRVFDGLVEVVAELRHGL